ncbi:AAA family ATPase [Nitrococcus mobilis]|uniref:DUF3696 domain-containing protein n=1 Tax=Nitrococcus mobilis Nb-231 TaxID=314278 RepID=A4BVJ5_9GAMM|nr:DUF3696 domain-containing protein [Nitrococcus mobilis]EAR20260.1 hypothetical protein NB231_12926 [Nitrococcus mobilis Nb-231]
MLTELRIKNFKAWKDTGRVRLAPLTVIFGANSAGKSSLGHLLLGLQQTTLLTDRRRAIHLGDRHSPIDLGTLSDCLYEHDMKEKLEFTLGWRLPQAVSLRDPLAPKNTYKGDRMRLESVIRADSKEQPQLERFRYELRNQGDTTLSVEHGIRDKSGPYLDVDPMRLVMKQGRKWPIEAPEKFYRFSGVTLARYQNADALSEFPLRLEQLLADLTYLGPLREPPQRTYSWAGDTVPEVGARGELAIPALLAATHDGVKLNRGPGKRYEAFDAFVARWLRDLGVIDSFVVRPIAEGRKEYEVLVRTRRSSAEVKLTDVGFGVSQVLPALVQAFYAQPNSTVWMEQPEIHLHPQAQAELADAFISAVQASQNGTPRNVQLIVESHSEHFLQRLQRRVAEQAISPDEVAAYFVRQGGVGVKLVPLQINPFGDIENWPDNFFADEMAEITARTVAAMRRKQQETGSAHE